MDFEDILTLILGMMIGSYIAYSAAITLHDTFNTANGIVSITREDLNRKSTLKTDYTTDTLPKGIKDGNGNMQYDGILTPAQAASEIVRYAKKNEPIEIYVNGQKINGRTVNAGGQYIPLFTYIAEYDEQAVYGTENSTAVLDNNPKNRYIRRYETVKGTVRAVYYQKMS